MITVRKSAERGHFDHGWLNTYHTFSFAEYMDPAHMGFRVLRVINEDRVQPGEGFPRHPHREMEIVTYILEGALKHEDSMGTGSVIHVGEVQRMSAGTGVTHSEYNPSSTEPVHLFQIWILPEAHGLTPSYEQKNFPAAEKLNKLRLVGSHDGREGSVTIHQDVDLYDTILEPDHEVVYHLPAGRYAWVQIARGAITLNGQPLDAGDGAAVSDESTLALKAKEQSELLLFDLP